jgi:hypothetical protein
VHIATKQKRKNSQNRNPQEEVNTKKMGHIYMLRMKNRNCHRVI